VNFASVVGIRDRHSRAVGAAWLRDVSKCHRYGSKKIHCSYIRVNKIAPRNYQKLAEGPKSGILHGMRVTSVVTNGI